MAVTLKERFSMIRDREEVVSDLYKNTKLLETFRSWSEEEQEQFLDYCTGVKGVRVLYDNVFNINKQEFSHPL